MDLQAVRVGEHGGEQRAFINSLLAATTDRRIEMLSAHVREQVLAVLKMPPTAGLDLNQGLFELGMDSLTALEVRGQLQKSLGLALPATVLFEHGTILALARYLNDALAPATPEADSAIAADDTDPELARLLAEVESLSEGEADQALNALTGKPSSDGHSA